MIVDESKDIQDLYMKSDLLETMEQYRMNQPIHDAVYKLMERTSLYIEFLAAAFIKETGLKASECELVSFYDPMTQSFHWRFQKKNG